MLPVEDTPEIGTFVWGTGMTMLTPNPMIPVCGVKETIYRVGELPIQIFCVKNKGHTGPHVANVTWQEDE